MKMSKFVIAIMALLTLAACNGVDRAVEVQYTVPDELKDCKIFYLESKRYVNLTVMRCPNSTTSTTHEIQQGKTRSLVTNVIGDSP